MIRTYVLEMIRTDVLEMIRTNVLIRDNTRFPTTCQQERIFQIDLFSI